MKKLAIALVVAFSVSCLLAGCSHQGPDPQKEREQLEQNKANDEKHG